VALCLYIQAELYFNQGNYAQAEPLYRKSLKLNERAFGATHAEVAHNLIKLVLLYHAQGKYAQAEPLYPQLLTIFEHTPGLANP
jgi:tetratricopeptide (TPR) repeat protein